MEYDNSLDVYIYQTGEDIIKAEIAESFDVVIMDIQLVPNCPPDDENVLTGIDIAYQLKQIDRNIILIYFSGLYNKKMIKTEPFDFLQKPISQTSVNAVMERITKWKNHQSPAKFTFSFRGIKYVLDLPDILYFYSVHRLIIIHTKEEDFKFYDKLDHVQRTVDGITGTFVRISKSYYVNMLWMEESSKGKVVIAGEELTVSNRYKKQYEEGLERHYSI